MTKLEKYGYVIDKLNIDKGRREIGLSIQFRVHESDSCYSAFLTSAQRYLPCTHIYKKEDVLRYKDPEFSSTDEERGLYLESIAPGANNAIAQVFNRKSNFEIGTVLLWNNDLSKEQEIMQYNPEKTFHYKDGKFSHTEFVENNGAVRELLKTLRDLKHYRHKPIKRDYTTDLWCTLKALDLFWS